MPPPPPPPGNKPSSIPPPPSQWLMVLISMPSLYTSPAPLARPLNQVFFLSLSQILFILGWLMAQASFRRLPSLEELHSVLTRMSGLKFAKCTPNDRDRKCQMYPSSGRCPPKSRPIIFFFPTTGRTLYCEEVL